MVGVGDVRHVGVDRVSREGALFGAAAKETHVERVMRVYMME